MQAVLDMLSELPKWVKMTKVAPLLKAAPAAGELASAPSTEGVTASATADPQAEVYAVPPSPSSMDASSSQRPQDEPEASLWNMASFLRGLQESEEAKDRPQLTKSPSKDHHKTFFDLLPRLHFRCSDYRLTLM